MLSLFFLISIKEEKEENARRLNLPCCLSLPVHFCANRGDKLAALLSSLPNDTTGYSCHRTLGLASDLLGQTRGFFSEWIIEENVTSTPRRSIPRRNGLKSNLFLRGGEGKKSCSASRNKIEPNVAYISSSGWHGYEENINIALRSFLQIHSIRLVESRFRFFFPIFFSLRRGGVLRLFINEKKEEGREKIDQFRRERFIRAILVSGRRAMWKFQPSRRHMSSTCMN